MTTPKSDAIPVRLDDDSLAQLEQIARSTRLTRSFIMQAAVRLALKRAGKGDRSWLLNEDSEDAPPKKARCAAAPIRTDFFVISRDG